MRWLIYYDSAVWDDASRFSPAVVHAPDEYEAKLLFERDNPGFYVTDVEADDEGEST